MEQVERLQLEDVYGVSVCRPLQHPLQQGWIVFAADRYILAWDWQSLRRRVLAGHHNPVQAMAFTDNGSTLFSTDGIDFIEWNGSNWRLQLQAERRVVGAGKERERRSIWHMTVLGDRLLVTAEGPLLSDDGGAGDTHVLRVWDPGLQFKMLTEFILKLDEALHARPVQLLALPGTFSVVAVTTCSVISFRYECGLATHNDRTVVVDSTDAANDTERNSCLARGWYVQSAADDEFIGAMVGVGNSILILSAHGVLLAVDMLKGNVVGREVLSPDRSSYYTACHLSGRLLSVGEISGGMSVFRLAQRKLLLLFRMVTGPFAQRDVIGRIEHKHMADDTSAMPCLAIERKLSCSEDSQFPAAMAVAVSDANDACVTLCEDLSLRVMDVRNRRVVASLCAHHGKITCLAVAGTPLGDMTLISGALDELLLLCPLSRRHVARNLHRSSRIDATIPQAVSSRLEEQLGGDEALSLGDASKLDMARLMHPSLSFCRRFRRNSSDVQASHGSHQPADSMSGAAGERRAMGAMSSGVGKVEAASLSAIALAVHPSQSCLACGTAAGKLIVVALPGGAVLQQASVCNLAIMGLSYGPSGRWLVVRDASGCVLLLDALCGYRRVCLVQNVNVTVASVSVSRAHEFDMVNIVGGARAGESSAGYWPCWAHQVVCLGETLSPSAASHYNASVVHIVTRSLLRSLAVYRVNALSEQSRLLYTVALAGTPLDMTGHPSGHYVLLYHEGDKFRMPETADMQENEHAHDTPDYAEGRIEFLHLMTKKFKGSFAVPAGTIRILADPSGLFVASLQCVDSGGSSNRRQKRRRPPSLPDAGESIVSIWCATSGDLRARLGGLPHSATEMAFAPDSSALTMGVAGGQLLVLSMPASLRAQARRVLFGRHALQEFWLTHPIDMQLDRARRVNQSLARQVKSARCIQAFLRRAIDPVGPCIHCARVLIPIMQRNAAVRCYLDWRASIFAARSLQAASRCMAATGVLHQQFIAILDLQRRIRSLLSLREFEEVAVMRDRAAAAAMTAQADPSGWGLWEYAPDAVLVCIPQLLLRAGQFETLHHTLSLVFLSRLIEARGVDAALMVLRCSVTTLRSAIHTRQTCSRRIMSDHEINVLQYVHQSVSGLHDLVSSSTSVLVSIYRRRTCVVSKFASESDGGDLQGGKIRTRDVAAGVTGWGGESLSSLAEERSLSDGRLLYPTKILRACIARLFDRAVFLLQQSSSLEAYLISVATPLESMRARCALNHRLGARWNHVWARLRAKGLAHDEGGVVVVCSLQHVANILGDPCTDADGNIIPGSNVGVKGLETVDTMAKDDVGWFALTVLSCLGAIPVLAAAKEVLLKLRYVLRLGLTVAETPKARHLESHLTHLLLHNAVPTGSLSEQMRVLSDGVLATRDTQRYLGLMLEAQLDLDRPRRQYLKLAVAAGASTSGGVGEQELAGPVRSRVCTWLKHLYNKCAAKGRETPDVMPLMQVVRLEREPDQPGKIDCTVAVRPSPLRSVASLASGNPSAGNTCDLAKVVKLMVEEFCQNGAEFGGLDVHRLAHYEGSLFLQLLSIVPRTKGGILAFGKTSQTFHDQEMYNIFTSHTRETLVVQDAGRRARPLEADTQARWNSHAYSIFEAALMPRVPLMLTGARLTIELRNEGSDTWEPAIGGLDGSVQMPDGEYCPGQLVDTFNSLFTLACQKEGCNWDRLYPQMVLEQDAGARFEIKLVSGRQFRLHASGHVMIALGFSAASDGHCHSVLVNQRWELSARMTGASSWQVPATRAFVAQQWVATHQMRDIVAATGLPADCIRVLSAREGDVNCYPGYVRTVLELASSIDLPLTVIREACDVLEQQLTCRNFRANSTSFGDALSYVLSFSVSEGTVPPACERSWQTTGPYVLASAADVQSESKQLSRLLLPALRHSLARHGVDFRWAGASSPFRTNHHQYSDSHELSRCLSHMDSHRLPGGKAFIDRGPSFVVGILAEVVYSSDSALDNGSLQPTGASHNFDQSSVAFQIREGVLRHGQAAECFVLFRDPSFMLSTEFRTLTLRSPTLASCFANQSDLAEEASKGLKRRILETLGTNRVVSYSARYRGRDLYVEEVLREMDMLRECLFRSAELKEVQAERYFRLLLQGARNFFVEHFRHTRDQRLRAVTEDENLRALCEDGAGTDENEAAALPLAAAQAVSLDVEEAMALCFWSLASTVENTCLAAPVQQPVHSHVVWRESQEALLEHYHIRCADLSGLDVTSSHSSSPREKVDTLVPSCRGEVLRQIDSHVVGHPGQHPPVLLLESAPFYGKTSTLAQWLMQEQGPLRQVGRDCACGGIRHVLVFAFAAALSAQEVLVHLAIEIELQWLGFCADHDSRPQAFQGHYDALLSGVSKEGTLAACAQALRQTLLQVTLAGGRVVLAVDGLTDENILLVTELVWRCHQELVGSLPYRVLAETRQSESLNGQAQAQREFAEDDDTVSARKTIQEVKDRIRVIEEDLMASVKSAATLQDWQRLEDRRSRLEHELLRLRSQESRAGQVPHAQKDCDVAPSGTRRDCCDGAAGGLGCVKVILTRSNTPVSGPGLESRQVFDQKKLAQDLQDLVQEGLVASRVEIPPLTELEASLVAKVCLQRARLRPTLSHSLAAKAGAVSPLYVSLAVHEAALLPLVTEATFGALPDSLFKLWGAPKQPLIPRSAASVSQMPLQPDYMSKFGLWRIVSMVGEPVFRAICQTLLEASCAGFVSAHGAALSVLRERAREAAERANHDPVLVVSRGGWLFARNAKHASGRGSCADLLFVESLPLPCKLNGLPAVVLQYDRGSCTFHAQGTGPGWHQGLVLELQPLLMDASRTDALYDKVEQLVWELASLGLVRAERRGGAPGEPIFFVEHPALLTI